MQSRLPVCESINNFRDISWISASNSGCRIRAEDDKFWMYLVHAGLLLLKRNDHSSTFCV